MAHRHRSKPSHERWLVSYADFMTLLFAFFATMYAISSVDAHKLSQVAHALQVAFDDSARGRTVSSGDGLLPERGTQIVAADRDVNNVRERISRDLAAELAGHQLEMSVDRRGLVLSIPEAGSFSTGSAELSTATQALIGKVAAALVDAPNAIRVEGHTDDVPIHTSRYRSNWELSTARATAVVEFLTTVTGISAERLSAAGYGEFRPRAENADAAGRSRNRRVDLVVLNESTSAAEEPAVKGQPR